eukprot:TRINITY_DN9061_c0_g2_i2.p2 TRINITY_DN9061_c0_g2~~TRINITY_DN9061_c0_g2_i2.p2  ORF type:complete len:110 (+),score=33.96 TRINITY_DN9061_c0_g2_i2:118-447(+)
MEGAKGNIRTEEVKTNQRSLIVKVLARYATDFFSLKELVQNADDAGAMHVQIRLTRSTTPGTGTFSRLVVRNNGRPFQSSDWERITTIAGGNPDSASVSTAACCTSYEH